MLQEYDACLRCSLCDLHCPVLRVSPDFPGPKNGGPGLARLRAAGEVAVLDGLDLCLGCRSCDTVCPSGIRPAELIVRPKAEAVAREGLSRRDWVLTHTPLVGPLAVRMPGLVNRTLSSRPVRRAMERMLKIDRRAPMPRFAAGSFRSWFARRPSPRLGREAPRGRVAYFHGCSVQYMEPHVGRYVVEVLEHNGFEVLLPEQKCCGLPLIVNGDLEGAAAWARFNIDHLLPLAEEGVPIVVSSTSCSLTLKHDYARRLGLEGAARVGAQVYDVLEFLALLHEEGLLRTDFRRLEERLPYHQPCHQRAQGIGQPALELLRLIPGVEVWPLDAGCCGAAGTFGFKREYYEIAQAVGDELRQALLSARTPRSVSECESCRWQMEHLAPTKAVHPISILWEAYGL